jgi:HD-GYP domain-containing protein (c-di-GMP phosphodiesterase class II)
MHRLFAQQIPEHGPLPWNIYDASANLLLEKGCVVNKYSHLSNLIEQGIYVDLACIKSSLKNQSQNKHQLDAWQLWEDIQNKLGLVLKKPLICENFVNEIEELADLVTLLSEDNADIALAAIMLIGDEGKYPITHSLHCAVMAELVSKQLKWAPHQRKSLCCAALTMNIAMLDLQHTLYHQIQPPTPEQKRIIDKHPEDGFRMLYAHGVRDSNWLQIVVQHHEQRNGTGYPRGLQSPSPGALLLRTVDMYCAKVSQRAHRHAILVDDASRLMFAAEGRHEDNPYPRCLIKQIGLFPPGSFVKLANGETGIVFKRGAKTNTPWVFCLTDSAGRHLSTPIKRDTNLPEFHVLAVMNKKDLVLEFNPKTIWQTNY